MRNPDKLPAPVRWSAAIVASGLGFATLTACSQSSKPNECLTTPVVSRVYQGSPTHKGLLVTLPHLGGHAIGLAVGFRTTSGRWNDSGPIPESFLAQADQKVVVGIKGGQVQFRFAEVVSPERSDRPRLGSVALSAPTTGQAPLWRTVEYQGVQPAWSTTPTTIPAC